MARVTSRVHVRGEDGQTAVLAPGDTVPEWATVTNPDVLEDEAPEAEPAKDDAPEAEAEETPAPAPAPRKRTAKKAAPASE